MGRHFAMRTLIAVVLAGFAQLANADLEYSEAWGPATGTQVPLLNAQDQEGAQQTFESLTGRKGLLVIFNRSVDW